MQITEDDADTLRHSLGIVGRKKQPSRNFYATEPDDPQITRLAEAGLMRRGRNIPGGLVYFHVTEAGAAAVGAKLPAL